MQLTEAQMKIWDRLAKYAKWAKLGRFQRIPEQVLNVWIQFTQKNLVFLYYIISCWNIDFIVCLMSSSNAFVMDIDSNANFTTHCFQRKIIWDYNNWYWKLNS